MFCREYLKIPDRQARRLIEATGEESPAKKHDGSAHRKPPQYCVPTPDGHDNLEARAAFQKEVRRCLSDEVIVANPK